MSKVRRSALIVLALLPLGVVLAPAASAGGTCIEINNVPPPQDIWVCIPV